MKIFFEIIFLIIIILLLFCIFFIFAKPVFSPNATQNSFSFVCINKKCFSVQSAETEAEREKGLMNVEKLDKDKGIIFIFNKEGVYPFWMKNTLIPLDIIWIKNDKVVFIEENAQPCKTFICPQINPKTLASYVLEINGGISKEMKFKIGDEVKIK